MSDANVISPLYELSEADGRSLTVSLDAAREVLRIADKYATAGVNWTIHRDDGGMADKNNEQARRHYIEDSASGMRNIFEAMIATGKTDINRILDMPSGYGRLVRHLKAAFPEAEITACDIIEDAVNFCYTEFGVEPVLSRPDVLNVDFGGRLYDIIWSGSFFTHLPMHRFKQALELFSRSLVPGGIAIFTTHGRFSSEYGSDVYLPPELFANAGSTYRATGFGYADYDHRYSVNEYGVTLSSPAFVTKMLEGDTSLSLVSYIERGWDDHQDVVVLQKRDVLRPR